LKNNVEPDRTQMTIWLMRISSWIHKAKNTLSEYVIFFLFHCNNGSKSAP
jgi:hypothetical protein